MSEPLGETRPAVHLGQKVRDQQAGQHPVEPPGQLVRQLGGIASKAQKARLPSTQMSPARRCVMTATSQVCRSIAEPVPTRWRQALRKMTQVGDQMVAMVALDRFPPLVPAVLRDGPVAAHALQQDGSGSPWGWLRGFSWRGA